MDGFTLKNRGWRDLKHKITLKTSFIYLGLGMLQLTNCCLERVKTWRSCNIFWESIPLDNSQRKDGQQPEERRNTHRNPCQCESDGMAISGYPMSGLDVIGKGHCHEAIYYFVNETEMAH